MHNSWHARHQTLSTPVLLPASHPALCEALFIPCHQLHRVMQRPGQRTEFLCCLLRISKSLWTRGDVVLQQQIPFPKEVRRWLRSPQLRLQGVLCWARGNHPELKGNTHEEKAQSPHRSSKEKDYSSFMLPPDKLSPHFREFLTKTNWEQTPCLWQANTDKRSYSHIF